MVQERWKIESLFFRQLQTLFDSGVGLYDALVQLELGFKNASFSLALERAAQDLFSGASLSQALAKCESWFEPLIISLLEVGEKSGGLGQSLSQISILLETRLRRQQSIVASLTYPFCLFLVMCLVALLFIVFVAPSDGGLVKDLGSETPLPTLILIQLAKLFGNQFFWFAMVAGGLLISAILRRLYRENQSLRLGIDSALLKLPVVGSLLNSLDTARSLEILARCLTLGVDLLTALKFSAGACTNRQRKQELLDVWELVSQGQSLAISLKERSSFDPLAISLLEVGEESGRLDKMAAKSAELLSEDANQKIETALTLIEPMLLAVAGLVAGFIALAAFLPVMQLASKFA